MMVSPKSGMRNGESVACDFCNEQAAIFYCRADCAKLCLFCDQHVHSANALSLKHIRSQICDNCRSHPVSVRCATDNLVLCQDCDSDAHATCSVSAAHHRCPVQPFTGCPSASDLASAWGLHMEEDRKLTIPNSIYKTTAAAPEADGGGGGDSIDFMVPNQANYCEEMNVGFSKMQQTSSSSCGKQKQVILKQLFELFRRDLQIHGAGFPISNGVGIDGVRVMEDTSSFTVTQSLHQQRQEGQVPFTSLLMMQSSRVDLKENDESFEGEMLWNTNPRDQGTQIWDFNLGRLRGSGPLEVSEGANDAGFTIKSYVELSREVSLENTKGLGEIYGMNCSIAHEDIVAFKNNANNPAAIQGPTYESNIPIVQESSGSGFGNSECYGGSKDIKFMDQIIMVRGECATAATTKADIELLAKNRGNAMLRYKEKKKTRRCCKLKPDLSLSLSLNLSQIMMKRGHDHHHDYRQVQVVVFFLVIANINIVSVHCNYEVDVLYAWKRQVVDPNNVLQSWDPTLVNPCTWFHITCNSFNSVTRLDVGNAGLSGPLVPQLGTLSNLQYLELYNNNISGFIPKEIGNLKNLVSLDLYHNQLSGSIPKTLANLKSLKYMRLSSNQLTGRIPTQLFSLIFWGNLRIMDVSGNQLEGTVHHANSTVTTIIQDPKA